MVTLLHFVARRAAGVGTLAASFAALCSYIGQVAAADQTKSLTETKGEPIT